MQLHNCYEPSCFHKHHNLYLCSFIIVMSFLASNPNSMVAINSLVSSMKNPMTFLPYFGSMADFYMLTLT